MSNIQSLADQLGWCVSTKGYLNDLNAELRFVANNYDHMTENLRSGGYMNEFLQDIQQMQIEFQQASDALTRYIETEHLEYIDQKSRQVQDVLEGLL